MDSNLVITRKLKDYTDFLLGNQLHDLTLASIRRAREINIPLLKLFVHLSEEELYSFSKHGLEVFLKSFIEDKALETIIESNRAWKANQLPGIPTDQIEASDIVLAHNLRKHVLLEFLDRYTNDLSIYKEIALEIENFYIKVYDIAFKTFLEVQQEKLQREKDFSESLINFSHEAIVAFDKDLNYTEWNPRIEEITGIKKEKVLGKNIFKVFPNYQNTEEGNVFLRTLQGETIHIEARQYGILKGFYQSYLTPLYNDKNEIIGGLSIVHDVTDQKRSEEKLKEREYFINQVVDTTPDIIYVFDIIENKNVYSNKEIFEVLGYTSEEIRAFGNSISKELVHPEDIEYILKDHKKIRYLSENEIIETEYRVKSKSGEWIWLNTRKTPFKRTPEGLVSHFLGTASDITEKKLAQEKARVSQQMLEYREAQLLEAQALANVGSYDWILETDKSSTTPELRRIFGYEANEEVGFQLFEKLLHPEDTEKVNLALKRTFETGEPYNCEYRIYRKDNNELRYLWTKGKLVFDDQNKPLRLIGTVLDITQRRIAEEELKKVNSELEERIKLRTKELAENETQLKLITDSIPGLIAYVDKDERYQFMNESYIKWFGKEIIKRVGKTVEESVGTKIYEGIKKYVKNALVGNFVNYETEILDKNGKTRSVNVKYVPHILDSGEIKGFVSLIIDITEEKEAKEKLLMQAQVLESMGEGVSVSDENGIIIYTNPAEDFIFGYERGELLGKHVTIQNAYLPEENLKKVNEVIEQLKSNGLWKGEWCNIRKDGTPFITLAHITTIEINNKKLFVCVQEDITEENKSKEILKMNNLELHKINTDLDNFIYTASHDLKAPVSNIEGLMNTLKDVLFTEPLNKSETNMIFDLIIKSINRFKETIRDLTEITKIQKDLDKENTPIDICDLVEDVKLTINEQIQSSKARIVVDTTDCPVINFSKKDLNSILYNLISNAIKYRSSDRVPEIKIKTERVKGYILLSVKDNGLGIPESHREKIFSMFKRLHDHVEGTGIGLYIVKRIIENNDGKIEVESELNKGSVFKIYFRDI